MAAPPSFAGAVKLTEALALPAVAVPIVGASGTVVGLILLVALNANPIRALFAALATNLYGAPSVRGPLPVMGLVAPEPAYPPALDVTV